MSIFERINCIMAHSQVLHLTSKTIPLTAPQNVIAKLFGQQPVDRLLPKPEFLLAVH